MVDTGNMQKKTLEFLYEMQPKRKPSFGNYITSFKTIIVIAIFVVISMNYDYVAGGVLFVVFLWWDLPRTSLIYSMKLTNKANLKYSFNNFIRRYYTGDDDLNMKKILANKILTEKQSRKGKK